ncbi:MAG: hypothetical protein JZD41_03485 [Thermoproteus sp.]|nr:hypothetical protein [Thermoproteus sp.]
MAAARRMRRRGAGQEGYYGLKIGAEQMQGACALLGLSRRYRLCHVLPLHIDGLSMAGGAAFWIHAVLTATPTVGLFLMYTGVKPEAGPVPIGSCR